jgi:hypothetical protein
MKLNKHCDITIIKQQLKQLGIKCKTKRFKGYIQFIIAQDMVQRVYECQSELEQMGFSLFFYGTYHDDKIVGLPDSIRMTLY